MCIQTLLPRRRVGATCLIALALLGIAGFASTPAAAWTKGMQARQERYLACTARIRKDPPCNQYWTPLLRPTMSCALLLKCPAGRAP